MLGLAKTGANFWSNFLGRSRGTDPFGFFAFQSLEVTCLMDKISVMAWSFLLKNDLTTCHHTGSSIGSNHMNRMLNQKPACRPKHQFLLNKTRMYEAYKRVPKLSILEISLK